MSLLTDITTNPVITAITGLFATEPETPAEFDAADDFTIESGDFVLTKFGWWGVVNTVKTTSKGDVGYSVNMLYRTSKGQWIAPRNTSRMWVWESEIVEVLS